MSQPVQYGDNTSGYRAGAPKPCMVAGTPLSSGDVQTGQVKTTAGGGRSATYLSGIIGGDKIIFSGAGRLDQILVINNLVSGQSVIFYDSSTNTSGGPFGNKVIGVIPPVWRVGGSGVQCPLSAEGTVITPQMPFQSGLCVAAVASGTPGFSVSWTPEVSTAFQNP